VLERMLRTLRMLRMLPLRMLLEAAGHAQ